MFFRRSATRIGMVGGLCISTGGFFSIHAGKGLDIKSIYIKGTTFMTYIVNDNCIGCKYTDCVEVCPVDCFYEGENMLVIHPDECIDCGVCEPECPVDAIKPDTEPGAENWVEFNRKYSELWPVIITKKDPLPEADERDGEDGKLEKYFSEAPGEGG